MIDPSWFGTYSYGDAWEGGESTVRLMRGDNNTVRFEYHYESRSNHGYDIAKQMGIVIGVDGDELTIELSATSASSWEDWYKEAYDDESTTPERRTATIELVDDHLVMRYLGKTLWRWQ